MHPQTRSLRVVTWNIHKGIGGVDRRYDLDRVIDVLRHYDADILLLQEVAQAIPQLRYDDQVDMLTEELEMHAAFHPEHQFKRGGYGNLILSRFPLHDVEHLDLTVGFRKRRGLLQAYALVPIGSHKRSLVLHNLHLGLAGSERGKQLQRFVESKLFQRVRTTTPLIVGGDLNDLWGTLGPKYLIPRGLVRAGQLRRTFPAAFPLRPLDGIFYRGDLLASRADIARIELATAASDHLPLVVDFEISLME